MRIARHVASMMMRLQYAVSANAPGKKMAIWMMRVMRVGVRVVDMRSVRIVLRCLRKMTVRFRGRNSMAARFSEGGWKFGKTSEIEA